MGPSVEDHIYQAETSGIIYATVNDGELAMLFVIWSVTFPLIDASLQISGTSNIAPPWHMSTHQPEWYSWGASNSMVLS